ncbi:MAG TPA: RidA family protein [Candidatus Binataceae bacterium]|nr:RidA family protein [Candidatus Binataceae bacterium]
MRKEFRIPELGEPISHYTHAVQFGDVVFVSGIVARGEHGELIGGDDPAAQTRQIFKNLERVLKAVGAGITDVLKVTVFLTDMNDRVKINPVRQEYFGAARPASTLVEISRLALPGARVEIEFVVGLPGK